MNLRKTSFASVSEGIRTNIITNHDKKAAFSIVTLGDFRDAPHIYSLKNLMRMI